MPSGDFIGTFPVSVYKQRFMLPTQFQKKLTAAAKQTFILTIGFDNTIAAYSLDNWIIYRNRLQQGTPKEKKLLSNLYKYATEQQLEGPGRLKISDDLMRVAQITDMVEIVGYGTLITIIAKDRNDDAKKNSEEITKEYEQEDWYL